MKEWITQPSPSGMIPEKVSKEIREALVSMAGKKAVISLKPYVKRRSISQNRYLFGVVVKMITDAFREAGNNVDADDVFLFLKLNVWKMTQVFVTPQGEVFKGIGSTRNLTTQEFELRAEQARAWAAEVLYLEIPLPNEELPDQHQKEK